MKKPSVTELIKLLDKPALMKWANRIGLQGIELDEYRKNILKAGTSIHSQIELFIKENKPFEREQDQSNYLEFIKDKSVIKVEEKIETDWFTGRVDLIVEWNGKTYICDFKNNQENIYFENVLQLTAYKMAIPCDFIAVIGVPKFKFMPVYSIKDFTPYEEIIKSLSNIYTLKQRCHEHF